ncbi:MAG: hypothetical protein H7X77_04920, partial [Anaerolineae bacterium]|nr:hypothetical protein [Anaerolineae bacterium]
PPVYILMQDLARSLGLTAAGLSDFAIEGIVLLLIFSVGGLLLPALAMLLAGTLTRTLTRTAKKYDLRHTVAAFAPAFVPIGFGIWIGHYGFHFLIGALSIIPVFQTFLIDHRITLLGKVPNWALASAVPDVGLIGMMQVVVLVGGFLWSMVIAQRTALRLYRREAVPGLLPWALVLLVLMLATIAIFSQPMEMRGTLLFS